MDLYAYSRISDLDKIAKENNIYVPRLRGYRLMAEEQAFTKEGIERGLIERSINACKNACESGPYPFMMNPPWVEYSSRTKRVLKKYMALDNEGTPTAIKWEKIHGKNRKVLKYLIKKSRNAFKVNVETFNKYVGRPDVLLIHSRINADWTFYGGKEIEKQEWFLEKVPDAYDSTYCDIYARIKPINEKNEVYFKTKELAQRAIDEVIKPLYKEQEESENDENIHIR